MKTTRVLFLLVLMSCTTSKVINDYDTKTDFSAYRSFAFFDDAGKGLNELDVKRYKQAIAQQLIKQGLKEVDDADFLIDFTTKKIDAPNRNTIGIGIGGGSGNVGVGISGGIPIGSKKIVEEVTIDFVDKKSDQLIWQGVMSSKLKAKITPEERVVFCNTVAQKIIATYPPKKK